MARLRAALPVLTVVALFALLFLPLLDSGVQLFYRDTARLYYPVKRFIAGELALGRLPLWYPWSESGTSLLGQVTPGLLHPFTLLYLAFPFELAFKLNHLLTLPLAALSTVLLCRRVGASPWGAALGGIAYGGCGYLASMAGSNLPFAVGAASVPLAIERGIAFVHAPSPLRLLLAGLALALCALAGEPQSMLFAGLLGGVYLILERPRAAGWVAAWGACALLLSAPASLPAAARLLQSRRLGGVGAVERAMFSSAPVRLLGFVVPQAFDDPSEPPPGAPRGFVDPYREYFSWETIAAFSDSITIGPVAALLALFALGAGRRGRLLLAGAALLLLASTGDALGVEGLLSTVLPLLRVFRYGEKFTGPASLAVAVAAALGTDVALAGARRPAALLAAAAAVVSGASALLMLGAGAPLRGFLLEHGALHAPAAADAFLFTLRIGLRWTAVLCGVLAVLALLRARLQFTLGPALAALACAATAVDVIPRQLPTVPADAIRDPSPVARLLLRRAGPSEGRWRVFTNTESVTTRLHDKLGERIGNFIGARHALLPQYDVIDGLESAGQYFTVGQGDYAAAVRRAPRALFAALGVRFVLLNAFEIDRATARQKHFTPLPGGSWLAEYRPRPRAWVVGRARAGTFEASIARLEDPAFEVEREATLSEDAAEVAGGPGDASVEQPRPGVIDAQVRAPQGGLLLVSEHFDPGWSATVDGRPAPVWTADLSVLGVPLPPGSREVRLRFLPRGLLPGLAAAAAACALLALWALRSRRRSGGSRDRWQGLRAADRTDSPVRYRYQGSQNERPP